MSVMTMFANISYQKIHRTIIFQIVYIRVQYFAVILICVFVSYASEMFKNLSNNLFEKSPFLGALVYR